MLNILRQKIWKQVLRHRVDIEWFRGLAPTKHEYTEKLGFCIILDGYIYMEVIHLWLLNVC